MAKLEARRGRRKLKGAKNVAHRYLDGVPHLPQALRVGRARSRSSAKTRDQGEGSCSRCDLFSSFYGSSDSKRAIKLLSRKAHSERLPLSPRSPVREYWRPRPSATMRPRHQRHRHIPRPVECGLQKSPVSVPVLPTVISRSTRIQRKTPVSVPANQALMRFSRGWGTAEQQSTLGLGTSSIGEVPTIPFLHPEQSTGPVWRSDRIVCQIGLPPSAFRQLRAVQNAPNGRPNPHYGC